MSNFTLSKNHYSLPSLDELLDSLGFAQWITVTSSFILPTISLLETILCSLSLFIFHKKFKDPLFFYYRLLCIIYIIHLVHNIPYGFLFSPRYFPRMDTYISSWYELYYMAITTFLFHFEDVIQMGILLTRMKILSPFVRKHFSSKPWLISLSFFMVCVFIESPLSLAFHVKSFGNYLYYGSDGLESKVTFFYWTS